MVYRLQGWGVVAVYRLFQVLVHKLTPQSLKKSAYQQLCLRITKRNWNPFCY